MKYVCVVIAAMLLSTVSMAEAKLPFVGARFFRFYEGSAMVGKITIEKNGMTKIETGADLSFVAYQGKLDKKMKDSGGDSEFYRVDKNKIYLVDKKGKVKKECGNDYNQPCVTELISM